MPQTLQELEDALSRIDAKLRPIAKRRVDLSNPNWFNEMTQGAAPVDRAGVRADAQALMKTLVRDYAVADAGWRAGARALYRRFDSFGWGVPAPFDAATPAGFRAHLILFSLEDQGKDPRDAKLQLDHLIQQAGKGRIDAGPLLREVAALCGEDDPYGWGPTRQWLESAARGIGS